LLTADDWFADTERLRVLAAPLFSARRDDIAIIPSVLLSSSTQVSLSRSTPEHREVGSAAATGAARARPRSRTRAV